MIMTTTEISLID